MKSFTILLYAIAPLARAAGLAPSPVKEADSLITPPPPYPAGDALRAGGLPGMSPLRRGPLYDGDDAANPVEKRQVLATTCALIGGNPNFPLGCSGGASCATLTQGNWYGFACCFPGQQCLVETGCVPFVSYAACSADYNCAANPYLIKCGGTYPLCAAVTIQVAGQAFTRTTCAMPGYGYTASATWVAGQTVAATSPAGSQRTQAAQTQGGSGTTNQGLGGDGAVINGNGNVVNYNRSAAGRTMGPPLALRVVLQVVVGAVVVPLMVLY